jgi:hypothetical protein
MKKAWFLKRNAEKYYKSKEREQLKDRLFSDKMYSSKAKKDKDRNI